MNNRDRIEEWKEFQNNLLDFLGNDEQSNENIQKLLILLSTLDFYTN